MSEPTSLDEAEELIRYRLIEAIECSDIDLRIADIARTLVPVVDRIARERAAAEIRAAADWLWDDNGPGAAAYHHLTDRAAELDPQ